MRKLLLPLSALAGFMLISHTAFAAAPEKTLCTAGETPLFQCTIKGKQVSLCSSGGSKDDAGKLQYRFGTPQKIELSYPDTPQPANGKFFKKARPAIPAVAKSAFASKNGDYDYFLFERTVRTGFGNGPNNPEFSAGVITRHGKTVTTRLCSQDGAMKPASRVLPQEEFEYLDD